MEIRKKGIPMVFFDRTKEDLGIPAVVIDDYKGAFQATEHLIKEGCKRIAHLAGPPHSEIFAARLSGYKDALLKHHFSIESELILEGNLSVESGRDCMHQLINASNPPDGVFAVEDFSALGALQVLKEKKVSVPREVAIIGFANEEFGKYITPQLSTVDQQTVRMGEEAAGLLMRLSEQKEFYKGAPQKIVLEPKMIIRESSRKSSLPVLNEHPELYLK